MRNEEDGILDFVKDYKKFADLFTISQKGILSLLLEEIDEDTEKSNEIDEKILELIESIGIIRQENKYLDLLRNIKGNGIKKSNRTGIDTLSVFGERLEFDVSNWQLPLLNTKYVHFKSIAIELLWFLRGEDNIQFLKENGVTIWDEWADEYGFVGEMYGSQWRNFNDEKCDQIHNLIEKIKKNPDDRRLIVSAWNPLVLPDDNMTFAGNVENGKQALAPCHYSFQIYHNEGMLSLMYNQRSCDTFLGVPFNLVSYTLLLHMICHVTGMKPDRLIANMGDTHLYVNHLDAVKTQLSRDVQKDFPTLKFNRKVSSIDDFKYKDFTVVGYNHQGKITAKIAI